jgi:Na+-driven multidrug efflux pump
LEKLSVSDPIGYRKILVFWLPLSATWLMMSVEGPLLAALIARLTDPTFNLAAHGVAFSFALVLEAPIIMIMSASTALVRGRDSFYRLRNFTWALNTGVTLLMAIILIPKIFDTLVSDWIGLPSEAAALTWTALVILLPWPAAIGYRRFYQGILIRHGRTRLVAAGTMVRLAVMSVTAFGLFWMFRLPGAWVAAAALTAGVSLEAVVSRIMAASAVRLVKSESPAGDSGISYREIAIFYYPLALTSFLGLAVHPLITFFVGGSRLGLESLAVLPVVVALVFLFRSFGLAYQEVGIALIGTRFENYKAIRNFALFLALGASGGLALVVFTPLEYFWFSAVSGLSPELTELASVAGRILVILPALSVVLSFQRAMVVNLRITRYVSWATMLEVVVIAVLLYLGIYVFDWVGVYAAATALMVGRVASNLMLSVPVYLGRRRRERALGQQPNKVDDFSGA